MAEIYKFSNIYSGDNMELLTPPKLPDSQKIKVLIVHDERTYDCNESKGNVWLENRRTMIRQKSKGTSCFHKMELTTK